MVSPRAKARNSMTDALKDAWLNGRADRLGAKGEALAWALRKAWYAHGNDDYGLLRFVSENVEKPNGETHGVTH